MTEHQEATGHPSDETLAAFLDGVLDTGERERVIGHLAECDECRAFAADWARAVVADVAGKRGDFVERVGVEPAEEKPGDTLINCANCGERVSASDKFCCQCGAPLKAESMPEPKGEKYLYYEYGSLIAGIVCFIISFFVPGRFWQFLIAFAVFEAMYVYFRLKREVLLALIDAFRSEDRSREEEILERLRRRFKA